VLYMCANDLVCDLGDTDMANNTKSVPPGWFNGQEARYSWGR